MGDGTLMYPPAAPGAAAMPSTRLKNVRDGMEDYEFLHALNALYTEKKDKLTPAQQQAVLHVLDLNGMLAASWEQPELVVQRRAQAGLWIDRLSRM